jgi:hypothetical protein
MLLPLRLPPLLPRLLALLLLRLPPLLLLLPRLLLHPLLLLRLPLRLPLRRRSNSSPAFGQEKASLRAGIFCSKISSFSVQRSRQAKPSF